MSNAVANQLYLAYLGRPSDTAWRSSTTAVLAGGAPSVALQNAFYSAAVLDGTFSLNDSSSALVNKIFLNIFGFTASTFEQNAWATLINNGTITAQTAAWTIFSSYLGATFADATTRERYQTTAQSKLVVIDSYTNALANDPAANLALSQIGSNAASTARATITGISSQATAATAVTGITTTVSALGTATTGSTFTMTTGIDSITGTSNNDQVFGIIGTGATLQAGDAINGGSGTDTLRLSSGSATALATAVAGVTISSIETVSLIAPGDVALDASTLTGVTTLRVEDATSLNGKTITSPAGLVNVSLATVNGAATAGAVTWAAASADTTLNLTLAGYQGSATAANLTITGAGATTLNVTSSTAANKIGTFTAPATVTTLNLTAGTAFTDTNTTSTGATRVVITGSGAVALGATDFAATVTVDASAATGSVSMTSENSTALTYRGGSGNDTVAFNAGELTSADSIDLGAGNNTLSIADTALGGSGSSALNAVVNGITTAQTILSTGAATIDMSGVTARIISLGATVNQTITKLEAADKIVVNGVTAGTLDATASLGFTTLNLELNGGAAVAALGNTTTTGQANVNIVSSTTATTTAGANTIGAITSGVNTSFTITGSNALTITSVGASASVNGSAMTGALTVTGGDGASSFTGGTRGDTLTGATVAGGDTFVGGGGNDTINTGAQTGTTRTNITGGTGADAINIQATSNNAGRVYTVNATAAESFATAGSFDTVTFSNIVNTTGTSIVTLNTGLLSSTVTGATAVTIGTTTVTAGSFLAVGTGSATLTTTDQNFQIYQDSNSNGVIDATDLRVDFTDGGVTDTMAVAIVGQQIVVTSTGVA